MLFLRPSEEFGSEEDQKAYANNIDPRVTNKLDMVTANEKKTEGISSTRVRKGATADIKDNQVDSNGWKNSVSESIAEFVMDGKLYRPD